MTRLWREAMSMERLGRREFLTRAMQLGVAAAAAPAVLSLVGCGGGSKPQTCTDTLGLQPAQIRMRTAQAYVDNATDPTKACDLCALYTLPTTEGAFCGGCTLLAGPISPKGTCNAFAPKEA